MPIHVRPAVPADAPVIVDFNARLAWESEAKTLDRTHLDAGVRALLADPRKGRYFVACVDGVVQGQLMHTYEWSDWRNGDIWWLQSVYVAPEYRKQGLFRRLFETLRDAAAADPAVVALRLYVEEHNHQARDTYRRLGLRDAGYHVMEQMLRRGV